MPEPRFLDRLRQWAGRLKSDLTALYLACRDPAAPWYAKLAAVCVVAYAFSPIDLIPDFIPVLGYLDDLILVPLGVALALRLMPDDILEANRRKARELAAKPKNWVAASLFLLIWLLVASWLALKVYKRVQNH